MYFFYILLFMIIFAVISQQWFISSDTQMVFPVFIHQYSSLGLSVTLYLEKHTVFQHTA